MKQVVIYLITCLLFWCVFGQYAKKDMDDTMGKNGHWCAQIGYVFCFFALPLIFAYGMIKKAIRAIFGGLNGN
jgi:hypothetical protein